MELGHLIREHPDAKRCDLTLLLRDAGAWERLVAALAEPFRCDGVTHVAAVDAMGFALGGAVASRLGAGLVLLRKVGRSAWDTHALGFTDYSGEEKSLEVARDAIGAGDRVLIVDDWTETGAQLRAASELVEIAGGTIVGLAVLNADQRARGDERLARHRLHAVIAYA